MANEIYHSYDEGEELYALIWNKADDTVWNDTDSTWDTYTDADILKYDIPLTNQVDSDYHSADFPAAITTEGVYRIQIMWQVGGAIDADADRAVAQGELYWDGTVEIDLSLINADQHTVTNVYDEREGAERGVGAGAGIESEIIHDC